MVFFKKLNVSDVRCVVLVGGREGNQTWNLFGGASTPRSCGGYKGRRGVITLWSYAKPINESAGKAD